MADPFVSVTEFTEWPHGPGSGPDTRFLEENRVPLGALGHPFIICS